MSSTKCLACGVANFASSATCRRCGAELPPMELGAGSQSPVRSAQTTPVDEGRGFWRWALWILCVTAAILISCYVSLIASSDGLSAEERRIVTSAIAELERAGFSRESFALRHLVSYRSTDNWWNNYVGHQTAYAATNYPFAVVTLYPTFFKYPVDDVERATILLHESYHLVGADEREALQNVWIEKKRLGWTSLRYSHTRVWKNTREWTSGSVPVLFRCGADSQSDCLE
jgi:hypothetical protein